MFNQRVLESASKQRDSSNIFCLGGTLIRILPPFCRFSSAVPSVPRTDTVTLPRGLFGRLN